MADESRPESETITAPWDTRTVRRLNQFQNLAWVHPFTCGNTVHTRAPRLVAGTKGWTCPDPRDDGCEYTQNWAHGFMADPDTWPHGPFPRQRTAGQPCSCDRLQCDECRRRWRQVVADAATGVGGQILADLKGLAQSFVAGLQEGGLDLGQAPAEEPAAEPEKLPRWCCDGNAEDCVLCEGTLGTMPYPWICPGDHEDSPVARRTILVAAADQGKETLHATMHRLRVYDAAMDVAKANPRLAAEPPVTEVEDDEDDGNDALREAVQRLREVVSHPGQTDPGAAADETLSQPEMTQDGHVYLSTSCLHGLHDRCGAGKVQLGLKKPGDNGLTGLKVPARCKFCAAPCVCGCHQGETPAEVGEGILSPAQLRELYFKAVNRGLSQVVDWDGMDDLKPLKSQVIHAITSTVLYTRDRELQRLRHRLSLADKEHKLELLREMGPAVNLGAERNKARLEGRLEMLDEVKTMLQGECTSPFESIAYNNPFVWLRKKTAELRKALDERSHD